MLSSLVPAWKAGRRDLGGALRAAGREDRTAKSPRLRQLLVGAEMALAVVLVIGSALLLRSFDRLRSVDPGFRRGQVLTFQLQHPASRYPEMAHLNRFYDELLAEIRAIPGVSSAGATYDHPLTNNWTQSFGIENAPQPPPGESRTASFRTVTPEYFATLGIEILEGRGFDPGDDAAAPGAVIVNQAFARKFFPGRRPLGQRLAITTTHWEWGKEAIPGSFEIVGLVTGVALAACAVPAGRAARTDPMRVLRDE